jgi:hypothetical protein
MNTVASSRLVEWYRGFGATTPSHLGRKLAGPLYTAFSSARQATRQPSGNEERKLARNGRQILPENLDFHDMGQTALLAKAC